MPPNLTAADVDALERRMAGASSVDSVSVDKDVLAALIEGWRCWQMVEAMEPYDELIHEPDKDDGTPEWSAYREGFFIRYAGTAAEALRAALGEEAGDDAH